MTQQQKAEEYVRKQIPELIDKLKKEIIEWMNYGIPRGKTVPNFEGMVDEFARQVEEETKGEIGQKVVLYVEGAGSTYRELSHEDRLKLNAKEVTIYLGDTTEGVWGDDWNDAPDEHNSGTPYEDTVKGLKKITVNLGKPLFTPHTTLTDNDNGV